MSWDTQRKRLTVATDKEVRDQALESLRTYLGAQSQIAELDLLKLWKGLFYCESQLHLI
jgi:ribosomal RNA-processing protein 1